MEFIIELVYYHKRIPVLDFLSVHIYTDTIR